MFVCLILCFFSFIVKQEINNPADDEAIKTKEQAIIELGGLLAATAQAEGGYYVGMRLQT